MNKFLIPAVLIATVVIAGIFAFMPVEKASTVHGTLATSTSITNANTNTNKSATGADRFLYFEKNYTLGEVNSMPSKTIVRLDSGTTNGIAVITAHRTSNTVAGSGILECGASIGADGVDLIGGANAGNATSEGAALPIAVRNGTFSITDGSDILFGPDSDTSTAGGVCSILIQFDVTDG